MLKIVLAALHLEEGPEAVPLGAACVASALKAAFGAQVLRLELLEAFAAEDAEVLLKRIVAAAPDAAGFSVYSWNRHVFLEAASRLRSAVPGVFLFCGGPEVTASPAGLLLKDGGPFDALVTGEGEHKTVNLIGERFFSGTLPPIPPPPPPTALWGDDLARLPSPWLDGTLKAGGKKGVLWELSRGCPYACAYCYESKGDRRLRHFPEERLRKELGLFIREQVPYVFVLDPTFNIEEERALRLLDLIIAESRSAAKKDNAPHWHFEIRAERVSRAQAQRLARLGASVQIGLQTAIPDVSAQVGRFLDIKAFRRGIDILNRENIVFGLDLIYGLPKDSLAGFRRSLDFALSLYPNNVDIFRLSVLPGTVLRAWADNLNIQADDKPPYHVLSSAQFPAVDLDRAERLAAAADIFYNRGRAVAWFIAALKPPGLKPSVFLEGFAAFLKERGINTAHAQTLDSKKIETLQLDWLKHCYTKAGQARLFNALRELVREHGDWGRSLAGEQ